MQNIPFPVEKLLEHRRRKAHQAHENTHRIHAGEIPGHVHLALAFGGLDHLHHHRADAGLQVARNACRREIRHQVHAIFAVFRRVHTERDGTETLADQPLEFRSTLVREILVIGIDAVDILVMGGHPIALAHAGDGTHAVFGRHRVQQPRNFRPSQPFKRLIRVNQIIRHPAHGERQIDDPVLRHIRRRVVIHADLVECKLLRHSFSPAPAA